MPAPETTRLFDGKKFVWDGALYTDAAAARQLGDTYQREGFEVRLVEREADALVYTRRPVRQSSSST